MKIVFIAQILACILLIYWYFQHKYKPFLHLFFVISLFFISDIWRLLKGIYDFNPDTVVLINKIILLLYVPIVVLMVLVFWEMLKTKKNR